MFKYSRMRNCNFGNHNDEIFPGWRACLTAYPRNMRYGSTCKKLYPNVYGNKFGGLFDALSGKNKKAKRMEEFQGCKSPILNLEKEIKTLMHAINQRRSDECMGLKNPPKSSSWYKYRKKNIDEMLHDVKDLLDDLELEKRLEQYKNKNKNLLDLDEELDRRLEQVRNKNSFGKKPSQALKNQAKKWGIRLTVKRGNKRVPKSPATLRKQINNKKKRCHFK